MKEPGRLDAEEDRALVPLNRCVKRRVVAGVACQAGEGKAVISKISSSTQLFGIWFLAGKDMYIRLPKHIRALSRVALLLH